MRPTDRDLAIVELAFRLRLLRDDQIQTALFSLADPSGCQRRLTKLVRHRWLERLPRQSVTDPFIYLLGRQSVVGNRLMRQLHGECEFRRHMVRLGSIQHLLGVNDVRVRAERACRDLGWTLRTWLRPEELAPRMGKTAQLVPDGYVQMQRQVDGESRTASFFLELQRSLKSSTVLASKMERYASFYYSGAYQAEFGTRGLRVLVVFTSELGQSGEARARKAVKQAEQQGVTLARFGSLDTIRTGEPQGIFLDRLWWQPGQPRPVALVATTAQDGR